jgi:L-threonylcarbamoyladenylate synthase
MQRQTPVLSTHSAELFQTAVRQAAALLRAGELVAVPTETVYGLAANAFDARAVERIFEVKGRPAHNPIIVHVANMAMARQCAAHWPDEAERLAAAFWPGPLTLVVPRAPGIPEVVTAGGPTVGVRWPSHPFVQALIQECGFPLAAPSANLSNRVSPTTAAHVTRSLGGRISLIVDGGPSQVGIESTVLDLASGAPAVLRPGMIHEESLLAVLGPAGIRPARRRSVAERGIPRSPGQLPKHYAPRARLLIWSWLNETDLRARLAAHGCRLAACHVIVHTRIPLGHDLGRVSVMPHDAEAFARAIYAELHRGDELGAEAIVVEALPDAPEWRAIADRLQRAAG